MRVQIEKLFKMLDWDLEWDDPPEEYKLVPEFYHKIYEFMFAVLQGKRKVGFIKTNPLELDRIFQQVRYFEELLGMDIIPVFKDKSRHTEVRMLQKRMNYIMGEDKGILAHWRKC